MPLATLRARRRLQDAERAFYDAYGRGGGMPPHDLVIPLDYFARADVARALRAWRAGRGPPDLEALVRAWREEQPEGDVELFWKNLAFFLTLA